MTSTEQGKGDSIQSGAIDWSVLDQFLAFRKPGGPDPRRRIITIYLESAPILMDSIKIAVNKGDAILLAKAAHSMKSSSMNVGAESLASLFGELEQMGKADSIEDAKILIDRLETEYEAASTALWDALQHMDK